MTQKPTYEELERRIQELEKESDKRKQVEEALRRSEDCYRTLFDNNPIETMIVDREARITGYNLARKRSGIRLPDINNDVMYKDYAGKHKINMFEELMECIRSGISKEFPEQKYRDKFLDIKIAPFSEGAIITSINVTDRMQAEEELRESEARYRSVFENTGTATVIIEEDMIISMANKEFEKFSGYSREEIEGKMDWTDYIVKEDLERMKEYHVKRRESEEEVPIDYAFRLVDRQGNIKDISLRIGMVPGTKQSVASLTDITPLKKSLKEKEILLQEIHHRVKNNMQVISSLLNLQSQYVKDKESLEMFKESRNRILSMAFVHEKLYQSEDLTKINFNDYIRSITRHLLRTCSIDPGAVRLNINCSDVFLDINKAVPCGLIINELISNSLKHAFPEGKKGEITIDFHPDRDNRLTLVVSDTGTGFPEDINISDAKTLGLQLISALTDQLKGTLEIERDGGTAFKITFKA
ncbi:MAG: histidine kinase dimerization/phosphoacceptor domain -containing protein [Thermodesulfobacteriota bacterium]|nr:histidine kinase dimerization/phosphoacceptor domain -containing protein [Thermodesulfobacteriota bacterium]